MNGRYLGSGTEYTELRTQNYLFDNQNLTKPYKTVQLYYTTRYRPNAHLLDIFMQLKYQFAISARFIISIKGLIGPWFFYYLFYGSADRLFWGFGKKIKIAFTYFFYSRRLP